MSTEATVKFPVTTDLENDPDSLLSSDVVNGTFVVDGGVDGEVLVRDSAHLSGFGTLPSDGLIGPQGPQGIQGEVGPQGPQGEPGAAGGGGGVTDPLVVSTIKGGATATSSLTLMPTSGNGVGNLAAAVIFKVGNNGGTEVMRIQDNTDWFGIGLRLMPTQWVVSLHENGSAQARVIRYNGASNGLSGRVEIGCGATNPVTGPDGEQIHFDRARFIQLLEVGSVGALAWTSRITIRTPAEGILTYLNWSENDFDRLQFGGTTVAYPALKKNGATLETKLANDSDYAQHSVKVLAVVDGVAAPAAQAGKAVLFVDSADGDLKVIFGDGVIKTLATDS